MVLEDPDISSWHFNPPAPAAEQLIELWREAFVTAGGDLYAGRRQPELLRGAGLAPEIRADVRALPPGHPYLRLARFCPSVYPSSRRPCRKASTWAASTDGEVASRKPIR